MYSRIQEFLSVYVDFHDAVGHPRGICSYLFSCIVWFMCVCTHVQVHVCEVVCALCDLYVEVRSQPLLLVLRGYLIGL